MTKLWLSYRTTNLWRLMIIIIFIKNMVIDAFLACLFNVHYLKFLSMVHEYTYFLWIYLKIGQLVTCRILNFILSWRCWDSLKGGFNVEVIMAYNEHLWFIQSHTLHESDNSGEMRKIFADEIFALQTSTLLEYTRLPTIFADLGQT